MSGNVSHTASGSFFNNVVNSVNTLYHQHVYPHFDRNSQARYLVYDSVDNELARLATYSRQSLSIDREYLSSDAKVQWQEKFRAMDSHAERFNFSQLRFESGQFSHPKRVHIFWVSPLNVVLDLELCRVIDKLMSTDPQINGYTLQGVGRFTTNDLSWVLSCSRLGEIQRSFPGYVDVNVTPEYIFIIPFTTKDVLNEGVHKLNSYINGQTWGNRKHKVLFLGFDSEKNPCDVSLSVLDGCLGRENVNYVSTVWWRTPNSPPYGQMRIFGIEVLKLMLYLLASSSAAIAHPSIKRAR